MGPGHHGEHLQSPCLGISWGDTTKGCRHPDVRDFGVSAVFLSGITLQHEHDLTKTLLVFIREGGRGQAAKWGFYLGFPHGLWQAAEARISSLALHWDGIWECAI